jgi:transcriptional regulator with XRE-family HTH domain
MSQNGLARALGTSQNAIYRLENPRYGRPTISTLKKLASFFDVGLIVRFAPLSEIVDWVIGLSERSLNVPDFTHDTGFVARKAPQSTTDINVPIEGSIIYQQNIAQGGSRALTLVHDAASSSRRSVVDQASGTQWASPALQPPERVMMAEGS